MAKRNVPTVPGDLQAHVLHDGELVLLSFKPSREALSDAECRVAVSLARGLTNAEIAGRNGVSVRTVANQVAAILKKLGASSRSEVAARFSVHEMT